jgi:3-oxoacyl-[acyl-carrier protein] reductase
MDLNLKDKVVLVTGGSYGLGEAICRSFAAEGAWVVINYRSRAETAQALARELERGYGIKTLAVYADVSQEQDVVEMFQEIDRQWGHIDVLINNAAYCPTAPVAEMEQEVWNYTLQVNLTGSFLCCREFVKRLLEADRPGRIVNISSQAALRGSTIGHAPYDASKGGLISFTISLAREVCTKNITVNCVAPGIMETEMMAPVLAKNRQKYIDRIPLKRIGKPSEIADVTVFLASDRASYMTGATVDVSAGLAMH